MGFPAVMIAVVFGAGLVAEVASGGDWPQWRGPNRDGHAAADAPPVTALATNPRVLWKLAVGGGFASPVIAGGKLVYLDERDQKETAHCLDAATGKEIWSVPFSDSYQDEWGAGPRSTPFIDGDRVYAQSCRGEFRCLSLADGKTIWQTSFEKDFGVVFLGSKAREGTASRRGNTGAGVVDGDRLFLAVGNTNGAAVVCFDKRAGQVLWRSQNDEAAYAPYAVATLAGVRQVLAYTAEALTGIECASGRLVWRVPLETAAKRHAVTPITLDDQVIVSSHSIGLRAYNIAKKDDAQQATETWANKNLKTSIASMVLVDGHLYGQGPEKNFVCVNARTGERLWSQPGFGERPVTGYSSTLAVGRHLLVLTETGELVLLVADPAKYTELGRAQVCGKNWSHPAYVAGKLFLRDGRALLCLDLSGAN